MTREEAINVIKGARKYLTVGNPIWNVKKVDEAFDMAIEALSVANLKEEFESVDAEFTDLPDIPRAYYERIVGKMAHEINILKEQLESADAVQGEWVDWLGNGNEWECSVCKCSVESHGSIAYKYCPMCGARMTPYKGGDTE